MRKVFSKVFMVHIIKELNKNQIFLVRVVNKWNRMIYALNLPYKIQYNFTRYVYNNLLSIFNKIYSSKGGFTEKDPLEFTFILYKFIFEDLKLIEVIKFPALALVIKIRRK